MGRMKLNDFKKNEFYTMPKWILEVEGLKPADMIIYMLALNNWKLSVKNNFVNEKDEVYFYLTHKKIKELTDFGKDQVIGAIERLEKSNVIIAEKQNGKATKYFLESDFEKIKFKNKKEDQSEKEDQLEKEDQSEKEEYNQSDFKYLNKKEINKNEFKEKYKKENSSEINSVIKSWNKKAEDLNLKKIKLMNDVRKRKLKKIIKDFGEENIRKAIDKIEFSNFLRGENNRGWKIDFDFLIRSDKLTQILEDKYTDVVISEREKEEKGSWNWDE